MSNKINIKAHITEEVNKVYQEGKAKATSTIKDTFKSTERRLYALPTLERKLKNDKYKLKKLRKFGSRMRSASIIRYTKPGYRVSPEEMLEAIITDLEATIATDKYEIDIMRRALESISGDQYYKTVTGKYLESLTDLDIANQMPCDATTVWRNRKRLVQKMAVMLYGAKAVCNLPVQ